MMAQSEAMLHRDMPFRDIRPHPSLPTLEIRAMDVNADVEDTVALAILVRALVASATAKVRRGERGPRRSVRYSGRRTGAQQETAGQVVAWTRCPAEFFRSRCRRSGWSNT